MLRGCIGRCRDETETQKHLRGADGETAREGQRERETERQRERERDRERERERE